MKPQIKLIAIDDRSEWESALSRCAPVDIYHSWEYHRFSVFQSPTVLPYLFFFELDDQAVSLPFLLKPIDDLDWMTDSSGYYDGTSVYGYPGIVGQVTLPETEQNTFFSIFFQSLEDTLKDLKVVTFFSRLNPILNRTHALGNKRVRTHAETVVVDLTEDWQLIQRGFSKGHRYDIRKTEKNGVRVQNDTAFNQYDRFVELYYETMKRTGAHADYYFNRDYFDQMRQILAPYLKLFVAEYQGQVISASLFLTSDYITQYHLSGSASDSLRLGGAKLILKQAMQESQARGVKWFHFGGGVSSKAGSVMRFKAGFSEKRLVFKTINFIIDTEKYEQFSSLALSWEESNGLVADHPDFFPIYRRPVRSMNI